jgi:hypothetical protein
MVTAGTAIRANLGVIIFAFLFTAIEVAWVVLWSIAFSGTMNVSYSCDANNVCTNPSYGILFVLLLSFYFTQQVLQSSVHVTVAGTVGTWVSPFGTRDPDELPHILSTFCFHHVVGCARRIRMLLQGSMQFFYSNCDDVLWIDLLWIFVGGNCPGASNSC